MRAAVLVVLGVALGCRDPRRAADQPTAPAAPLATAPTAQGPSIYDLEITLVDQDGREIALDVDRGSPTLIAMFYASCPSACPRLIQDLQDILEALPAARRAEVRVLLVSFDAARDTPDRLRRLAVERDLDLAQWTLASASEADSRALAAVLGVKYRRLDSGEYFHSSVVTALDPDGAPLARLEGFVDVTPVVAAIR